jgi:hypothetical protein
MIVINNPQKTVTANYPIKKVMEAIESLPQHAPSAELLWKSEPMNCFRFIAKGKGLWSAGMYVEIVLSPLGENLTQVNIECRRQLGWIDNATELTESVNYMLGCITLIGKVLSGEKKL